MERLDEPAPDNTWHDAPDLSKDNLKSQFQSKVPVGKGDVKQAAGDVTQAANPDGSRDPRDAAQQAQQDAQQGNKSTNLDLNNAAQTAQAKAKKAVDENVDEDQKQKAREYRERTNNYFKNKVPKERREQTIYRLKKMVVEIQGHSDCMLLKMGTQDTKQC